MAFERLRLQRRSTAPRVPELSLSLKRAHSSIGGAATPNAMSPVSNDSRAKESPATIVLDKVLMAVSTLSHGCGGGSLSASSASEAASTATRGRAHKGTSTDDAHFGAPASVPTPARASAAAPAANLATAPIIQSVGHATAAVAPAFAPTSAPIAEPTAGVAHAVANAVAPAVAHAVAAAVAAAVGGGDGGRSVAPTVAPTVALIGHKQPNPEDSGPRETPCTESSARTSARHQHTTAQQSKQQFGDGSSRDLAHSSALGEPPSQWHQTAADLLSRLDGLERKLDDALVAPKFRLPASPPTAPILATPPDTPPSEPRSAAAASQRTRALSSEATANVSLQSATAAGAHDPTPALDKLIGLNSTPQPERIPSDRYLLPVQYGEPMEVGLLAAQMREGMHCARAASSRALSGTVLHSPTPHRARMTGFPPGVFAELQPNFQTLLEAVDAARYPRPQVGKGSDYGRTEVDTLFARLTQLREAIEEQAEEHLAARAWLAYHMA